MSFRRLLTLASLLLLAVLVLAADTDELVTDVFPVDPYLKYRPPFARSLPVQILLTGIVLTLTAVLFIHLMFTAQYHWPLAPVNYVLQLAGVTTLLISLIATIHVVLSTSREESQHWPYMLSYIAVDVPPNIDQDSDGWSVAERATWLVMTASTSGLIQITHIQFLTLLYPSRLEKQLIFALLGPMAIVAAVMQLFSINTDKDAISSAVKNVCNATLSLLFTVALFIWGLLVNRKQAWRTDGGTAAFGCAALTLALISTALNFIYVHREDEKYAWLQGLMWAVVLWQSFLGWWWWVGAGSGSGLGEEDDLEEKLRKEAKREDKRREAKERRQETRKRAKKVWRDVRGAFGRDTSNVAHSSSTQSRPRSSSQLSRIRTRLPPESASSGEEPPISPARSVISSSISSSSGTSRGTLPRLLPGGIHHFYASIRRAHLIAAQKQAVERVERIREMERNGVSDASRTTWGVSNLLWRTRPSGGANVGRYPDTDLGGDKGEGDYEMYERSEWRQSQDHEDGDAADYTTSEEEVEVRGRSISRTGRRREEEQNRDEEGDEQSSVNVETSSSAATTVENSPVQPRTGSRSLWWWGPLGRWRLQDSTTYS